MNPEFNPIPPVSRLFGIYIHFEEHTWSSAGYYQGMALKFNKTPVKM